MAYLAALTLDRGRSAGFLAVAGVAAGLSVHAIVAALGLGVLVGKTPVIYEVLRWTGVAYLLFLAWEGWQPQRKDSPDYAGAASGSLFWRGFLSNVFNPKSIIFFVSVVPGFVRYEAGDRSLPVQIALFGIVYVAIATVNPRIYRRARKPAETLADDRIPAKYDQASPLDCLGAGCCMARMDDAPGVKRGTRIKPGPHCSQATRSADAGDGEAPFQSDGNARADCLF